MDGTPNDTPKNETPQPDAGTHQEAPEQTYAEDAQWDEPLPDFIMAANRRSPGSDSLPLTDLINLEQEAKRDD